jgi:S1-C subfamily serine protease
VKSLPGARLASPFLVAFLSAALGTALGAGGVLLVRPLPAGSPPRTQTLTGSGATLADLNDQQVYDRIEPSVVDVTASLRYDDETTRGTGFVFDAPNALVLTNNHVVRDATSVTVTLISTGKKYQARIVGTDVTADIAVLAVETVPSVETGPSGRAEPAVPRLTAAPMRDSALPALGTPVLAIGNADGQGGPPTIAPGIINSLDRTIDANDGDSGFTETLTGMLQTSAQIEPGDSGGPLADAAGQVIGVDTAASPAGTPDPVGYAIPVDTALAAARQIAAGRVAPGIVLGTGSFLGTVTGPGATADPQVQAEEERSSRTDSGVSPASPTCLATEAEAGVPSAVAPVRSGALVEGVLCGTPAATAGMTAGDVIVAVAGRAVTSPDGLADILAGCPPGTGVPVTWADPGGATRTALLRLIPAPAP